MRIRQKIFVFILGLSTFLAALPALAAEEQNAMNDMQKVQDFLKNCGYYFLATDDAGQPQVRPFGTAQIINGKLYIQTGKAKDVFKQMAINPKIAIAAYDGKDKWLRLRATAVDDDNIAAKRAMLDAYPNLKKMYNAEDANTRVLYLKDVNGAFYSFDEPPQEFKF